MAVTRSNLVRVAHCQLCILLQCVYQGRQNWGCKGAVGQHVYGTGKRGGGCIAGSCWQLPNLIWFRWSTAHFAFFSCLYNWICQNRGCKGHWDNIWTKINLIFVSPLMVMIIPNCSKRKDRRSLGGFLVIATLSQKMTILVLDIVKLKALSEKWSKKET